MLQALDVAALRAIRGRAGDTALTQAMTRFTALGQYAALWLGLGIVGAALDSARREAWLAATRRVAFAYLINTAIKLVIRRPRPQLEDLPPLTGTPTQLSFPSAHATTSFAAAQQYARLGLPAALLHTVAAGLAWSRVYLGVHYPSDVIGGALLGRMLGR